MTDFARLLAGHLAKGTRPGTDAGEPWSYGEFAGELPGRRGAATASERSVSNWCRGRALPSEVEPILRALFGPQSSQRHTAARDELRNAFIAARNLARLQEAPPDPLAMEWEEKDGRLALRTGAPATDAEALNDPFVRAMHPQVTAKAKSLLDPAGRLRNSRGWEGLAPAAERLHTALCCDTDDIVPHLAALYSAMLELGSFYEQHNAVQPNHSLDPLDPEIARPLSDVLRTGAPWLRRFDTVRRQDDEAGAFLTRKELFEPARLFLQTAQAHNLVSTEDKQSVDALLDAGERGDFIGQKAGNRAVATVTALARAGTLAVATFLAGALSSDFATKSVLVQRAGDVLRDGEQHALALAAPLQSDLQAAIAETLSGLRKAPSQPKSPDGPHDDATLLPRQPVSDPELDRLIRLGDEALARQDYDAARRHYNDALVLARAASRDAGEARCHIKLGHLAFLRSDYHAARACYDEALPLIRRVGSTLVEAHCLQSLGDTALRLSDHDTARARYEEALPLHRRVGDVLGQANCINGLGNIALRRTDHYTAQIRFDEALSLYREVGDVVGEANCIHSLGDIAFRRSDNDIARIRYEDAMTLYRRGENSLGEANCIRSLGDIALHRSEFDTARAHYNEALVLYHRVGDLVGEANCIKGFGNIAIRHSDLSAALGYFEKALPLYRNISHILGEANCIQSIGDIALMRTEYDTARARYNEALPLYRQDGDVLGEANCLRNLGHIAQDQGDIPSARIQHEAALALFRRIPDPYSIGWTHHFLANLPNTPDRDAHLAAAREAWRSIGRTDLIDKHLPPPA